MKPKSLAVEGDVSLFQKPATTRVDFDPRFEIISGARIRGPIAQADCYEVVARQTIAK
jgi:hypothetical protein